MIEKATSILTNTVLDRGRAVAQGEMSALDDELIKQYLTV